MGQIVAFPRTADLHALSLAEKFQAGQMNDAYDVLLGTEGFALRVDEKSCALCLHPMWAGAAKGWWSRGYFEVAHLSCVALALMSGLTMRGKAVPLEALSPRDATINCAEVDGASVGTTE